MGSKIAELPGRISDCTTNGIILISPQGMISAGAGRTIVAWHPNGKIFALAQGSAVHLYDIANFDKVYSSSQVVRYTSNASIGTCRCIHCQRCFDTDFDRDIFGFFQ
jgi:hypothetical protein